MGNNLCRERAAAANDSKSTMDRILGRLSLHLCPTGLSSSNDSAHPDKANVYQIPTWHAPDAPQPPPRTTSPKIIHQTPTFASEWTEVPLQVPESPPKRSRVLNMSRLQPQTLIVSAPTPVPPPRKNRQRLRDILESGRKLSIRIHKPCIDEPPIVPIQKNHSHVCEPNKLNVHSAQRAISTVSLPNYKDLEINVADRKDHSAKHDTKRPSIARNVSLPGENGLSLSQATAQRLENYMTRCRSFGSLLPQQILDRLKSARCDSDVESEDSWGGLDDWDLGVIEHDNSPHDGISPVTPNSRLPSKKRKDNVLFAIGNNDKPLALTIPSNTKTLDTINPITKKPDIETKISNVSDVKMNDLSSNIAKNEVKSDEDLTPTNDTVPDFPELPKKHKRTQRRESIEDMEDWFVHGHVEPMKTSQVQEIITETKLGRRGSDAIVGYDTSCYPFKPPLRENSPFKSDNFFKNQLENEKLSNLDSKKELKEIGNFKEVEMEEDEAKMSLYTDYFNSMLPDESMNYNFSNVLDSVTNTKSTDNTINSIKPNEEQTKVYSSIGGDLHDIFPETRPDSTRPENKSIDKVVDSIIDTTSKNIQKEEEDSKKSMFSSLDEEMDNLLPEKKIENEIDIESSNLINNTTTIEVNAKDDHSSLLKYVKDNKLLEEQLSVDSIEPEDDNKVSEKKSDDLKNKQ